MYPSVKHSHPYEDDIPAFALGALDPEEAQQVSAHLAVCPFCRKQAADYEAVVGLLCCSIAPQEPPAHLRCRILAYIAACTECRANPAAAEGR